MLETQVVDACTRRLNQTHQPRGRARLSGAPDIMPPRTRRKYHNAEALLIRHLPQGNNYLRGSVPAEADQASPCTGPLRPTSSE